MPDYDGIAVGIHRLTQGVRCPNAEQREHSEYKPFINTCLHRIVELRGGHSFVKAFEIAHTEMIASYLKYKLVPPIRFQAGPVEGIDDERSASDSIPTDV